MAQRQFLGINDRMARRIDSIVGDFAAAWVARQIGGG
jgi:hypothetical protein